MLKRLATGLVAATLGAVLIFSFAQSLMAQGGLWHEVQGVGYVLILSAIVCLVLLLIVVIHRTETLDYLRRFYRLKGVDGQQTWSSLPWWKTEEMTDVYARLKIHQQFPSWTTGRKLQTLIDMALEECEDAAAKMSG